MHTFLEPRRETVQWPSPHFAEWEAGMQDKPWKQMLQVFYVYLSYIPHPSLLYHTVKAIRWLSGRSSSSLELFSLFSLSRMKQFLSVGNHLPVWGNNLQLMPSRTSSYLEVYLGLFLFRIILGMRWWKTASFKETKNPLQNTRGTVSCLVQWHHHCHSVNTTKHELLQLPVEWRSPSPFPHAPAFCHSCFSECSSEGLVVAYPRFGVLVSSPPPTTCSLRQHLHAEICLAPKWSQVSLPRQNRRCWREQSGW